MIRTPSPIGVLAPVCVVMTCALAGAQESPAITFGVEEGRPTGAVLGVVPHPDFEGELQFEIVGGNDLGIFRLDRQTGALSIAAASELDFESQSLHVLDVRVRSFVPLEPARIQFAADLLESGLDSDGIANLFVRRTDVKVRVRVSDVNEPPQIVEQHVTVVDDNGRIDGSVYVDAVDQDRNDRLQFKLIAGGDESGIGIDAPTGRLIVLPNHTQDANDVFTYPLTVQVTDANGQADAATIYVRRIDVRDPKPLAPEPATAVETAAPPEPAETIVATDHQSDPETTPTVDADAGDSGGADRAEEPESTTKPVSQARTAPLRAVVRPAIPWYWFALGGFAAGVAFAGLVIRRRVVLVPPSEETPAQAHPFDTTHRPPPRPIYVVPKPPDPARPAHPEAAVPMESVDEQLESIRRALSEATSPVTAGATETVAVTGVTAPIRANEPDGFETPDSGTTGTARSARDAADDESDRTPGSTPVVAASTPQPGLFHPAQQFSDDKQRRPSMMSALGIQQETTGATLSAVQKAPITPPATETSPSESPAVTLGFASDHAAKAAPRIDRNAVREELSSLRAVANEYARATFAQQTIERQARQSWMASAGCMAALTVVGAMTVSFANVGLMRSIGWLLLGGSVVSFGFCLYYFKQISLHEGFISADRRTHPRDLEMSATMELTDVDGEPV